MSLTQKKEMVKLLCSSPQGQIIACNMVDALTHGIIEEDQLKYFLIDCYESFCKEKASCATSKALIQLICKVAPHHMFSSTLRTNVIKNSAGVSTVMRYWDFKSKLFDRKDWRKIFGKLPPRDADCRDPGVRRIFSQNKPYSIRTTLRKNETIGRPRGCIWVTLSDELEKETLNVSGKERGTTIRDLLGLAHYGKDKPLVELQLTPETILSKNNARPTFIEAGEHTRFKAIPDLYKNKRKKGWGFTVNLKKLASNNKELDGLPERVVESIPTEEAGRVTYKLVGCITNDCESEVKNNKAYARRLIGSRTLDAIEESIISLI